MIRLRNCVNKVYGKLLNKADADALFQAAQAWEAEGYNPVTAERMAVEEALKQVTHNGEEVLRQIRGMRPQAYSQALDFWNRETIRQAAEALPAVPRFVTEGVTRAEVPGVPVSETTAEAPRARAEAPPAAEAAPPAAEAAPAAPAEAPPVIPPETPVAPITDAAQEVVNSLPEEQRDEAQKAFQRDDRDPMAEDEREKGKPVTRRKYKAVAPEKNTGLVNDLSRYGAFDKSVAEVVSNIASDPKAPRWIRLLADLFVQLGLGENVSIRVVNTPEAAWRGLYHFNRETGTGEVMINLSHGAKAGDFARILLHELMHHGTLRKLTTSEGDLTPTELAAKRSLQEIFNYVKAQPNIFKGEAAEFGATESLTEFVSEIFANDKLRAKLNSIKPDGKVSLLQRFYDAVLDMLIGERRKIGMRKGSLLEAAIKEAIKVAGNPAVEVSPEATAAMQQHRSRAARQANEHPNFQEEIANLIAPMANNMGISDNDLIERELDHKAAFYAEDERKAVETDVDAKAGEINATPAEIADVKKRIEDDVLYYRAYHPTKEGWANKAIKVVGLEEKKGLTRGDPTKQNPSGIAFKVKYADTPYTYARENQTAEETAAGKPGKPIQRFLKQGKPDPKTGKPIDNPEWGKRVGQLANKMFDNLQGIMTRRGEGGEKARVAQVIIDQINWYRDMRTRLRTEFGSMSDYVADVIAGLSPITDVPGNWAGFIDYFKGVMKGDYDEAFRKFDKYISADPKNRSSGTYKKEFPPEEFPDLWPRKLHKEGQPLFGANTGNVLMAGLDLWRAVKAKTAPKARNFGLNLIGQSLKATIDRWAGRYLQRMHAPTWRIPPSIEGAVTGAHMPGENVEFVSGDFGMGQDVFEQVAARLREGGHEIFKEVTAADLQAILWFAEKEVWEKRKWTDIMGAGSSMNVVAQATAAQRYEAGAAPSKTSAKDKKLMAETIELRTNLNAEAHMLGAKMVPSVNIQDGQQTKTFDGDWVTEPEYDPDNSVGHVAKVAARLGKKAAHISRVIVNPYEVNSNMTRGLHIFFKGRVGDVEIKRVLDTLKAAGITSGISLSVDPRVRPEIIKSLDPATGANQYNGVRVQHIPEYTAGGMTDSQLKEAFANVSIALAKDASVAESSVLYYDTLVLKKGTDYDTSGRLTEHFSNSRKKAWVERARSEGAAAAARRDDVQKSIEDRKRQDLELESRMEREREERIAKFAEFQRKIQPTDRANNGGVDPPIMAAMAYRDETEPTRDPHGGRASLVRSMVERIRNISRDKGGIEVPKSEGEVRGVAGAGSSEDKGRKGSAPIWRDLGQTFRKREAALSQKVGSAAELIRAENPEDSENPKDPARYENSQKLFDYLSGKEEPTDPELKAEIAELRKEIPVVSVMQFRDLKYLDSGAEASVYHDSDNGVVYKFYPIKNGALEGSYVPGQIRLDRGGGIRIGMGEKPTVADLMSRMERSNSHGAITPHELTAITHEGDLVFASPFVEGREVTQKNLPAALARAGVHFLSDLGATSGIAKLPDGRWVVYDDLHPGNVRTMPGGRVEIIDANNRELDSYEIADLTTLGKMPPEKPPALAKPKATKKAQKYENATVIAPMVETHHGTPHEWEPEVKVRFHDGSEEWVRQSSIDKVGGLKEGQKIIERAPAGRVREEFVGTGETNAAFGWGVLYSAARKALAEHYRDILTSEEGQWFLEGLPMSDLRSEEYQYLKMALDESEPGYAIIENIDHFRSEAKRWATPRPFPPSPATRETAGNYEKMADALEKYKDKLQWRKGGGNIYTVQLDVDDPELLDWFKPMKDQMFVFDKVAAQFGTTREDARKANEHNEMLAELANNMQEYASRLEREADPDVTPGLLEEIVKAHADAEKRWEAHFKQADVKLGDMLARIESMGERYTGEKFYERLTEMLKHSPKAASKHLDKSGVPGIVFIDRESRKVAKFQFEMQSGGETKTLGFDTLKEAESIRDDTIRSFPDTVVSEIREGKTFNNYVVFDPERIKVVGKNGEVVRTVAEDLPAPPELNVVEPVTVAAMAAQDVKDDTDLTVSPMAGTGRNTREDVSVENYKPAGWTAPFKRLSWEAIKFAQRKHQREAATIYRIQTMVDDFKRTLKKVYKGKLSPEENKNIMLALGNLDNRLTQEQAREAKKMNGAEREGFLHTAHMENVARFKQQQEEALNSLPDEIREAVNVLREELNLEAKETLRDTGLDTELRARLDANQGVFLHSNAFQHFEDDVWGKHIKSDDPKAVQIRRAAEDLFRNEIIGENALAYQKEQKAKGIEVSDEDALRFAAAADLDPQIATRLDDYLKKQADEPSRLHMLMGKMPVTRTEAGKMLSLDRENIPKEIRDLWGQYDDPATNFAKTLSILANHNTQTRMQNALVEDGLQKGYFWKQRESPGPRPPGLVQMTTDTRGPMVGVHGPPQLKEGLSLMNQRPVRSLMSELNSIPLMMKTVGSVGSAVRNFFGNPLFMVSNGNLPISTVYWPKAFWLSLQRAADSMANPQGRKQLARMIELGVLDENVDSKILERIAKNARMGGKYEALKGFGPAIAAVQRSFVGKGIAMVGRGAVTTSQRIYTMADNFWRLANYNTELLRQKWMNPDLSLEQQEENAAEITRKTLPTYSNLPEWFSESYGKLRDVAAPYLSFQAEAMRTYASTWHLAGKEIASGKPKEMLSGLWRLGGLGLATAAPIALGLASKAMFGYDDDDEKAIRNGLPEYQRNNMLFFLPRDENGAPRYLDLNFMNPYSLVHKAVTAAWRGKEAAGGAEAAAWSLAEPFLSPMPIPQFIADIGSNKNLKRGGAPIWDEYASPGQRAASILQRAGREFMPGTFDSAIKIAEAYSGKDILGRRLEKTGEKRDLTEEVMKVFPGTAVTTFDRDKAMQAHVGEYKKAARNASGLFDQKMSAEGPIKDGEVAETYKEADERSFRALQQMREAYSGLIKLGMTQQDAMKSMQIGFGSEIRKGGLSKTTLQQVVSGNYQQFAPSDALLKETARLHRERLRELNEAKRRQPRSRTASL